ncbi:type VI secretion system protein TssL, short form [Pseudomonas sp. dw_358]|uniref:type VI secretion system protein TssL, short form n=1 Tax=Pseudomonas sp. dw_358 TaxID=2720083 RepID=UPI001BD1D0BD|nr:type VI secretion system protein TssL, short form [Pseudomonas sp. dw_358]
MTGQSPASSNIDIDAALMGTWLRVVQLRLGGPVLDSQGLWARCAEEVERCRQSLQQSGMSQRSVQLIGYAQCALLDEAVLGCALAEVQAGWAARPLQAHFFDRHEGGIQVYEDLRAALADPATDPCVLCCYQRLLLLGFRGCYPDLGSPEREHLLARLNERVPALAVAEPPLKTAATGVHQWHGWSAPLTHGVLAILLLAGVWWALHRSLASVVASLTLSPV